MNKIQIKRIYEPVSTDDGYRILVDRLWPRGIKKDAAMLDEWGKDLAPSVALRKWFDHRSDRFKQFESLYQKELSQKECELNRVVRITQDSNLTLLYAAKDPQINHAIVLLKVLIRQSRLKK